jgi:DNA-binding winged helix-turn-helix (wHTH) protein
VQVTSKAFDLLLALIESGGIEITKEELMERVWANQIVEDANLTVTMSQLRKALGEKASDHRFIVTIPGRGYRFVGELQPRESLIVEQHTVSEIVIEELDDGDKSTGAVIRNQGTSAWR